MPLKSQSKLIVVIMAIVLGGCTTTQQRLLDINPRGTDATENREVLGNSEASVEESAVSEGSPTVVETQQGTTKEHMGKILFTTLVVVLAVSAIAANIAFVAAISH